MIWQWIVLMGAAAAMPVPRHREESFSFFSLGGPEFITDLFVEEQRPRHRGKRRHSKHRPHKKGWESDSDWKPPKEEVDFQPGGGAMDLKQMLREVNAVRAGVGARPLRLNAQLTAAAQKHSEYQASVHRMTHTGAGRSSPSQRVEREGYNWMKVGENVAWNQPSIKQVMKAWVTSPQHYSNLISRDFTEFGAGVSRLYWTQDFGTRL